MYYICNASTDMRIDLTLVDMECGKVKQMRVNTN